MIRCCANYRPPDDIQAKATDGAREPGLALAWREKEFAVVKQLAARDPDNIAYVFREIQSRRRKSISMV